MPDAFPEKARAERSSFFIFISASLDFQRGRSGATITIQYIFRLKIRRGRAADSLQSPHECRHAVASFDARPYIELRAGPLGFLDI